MPIQLINVVNELCDSPNEVFVHFTANILKQDVSVKHHASKRLEQQLELTGSRSRSQGCQL